MARTGFLKSIHRAFADNKAEGPAANVEVRTRFAPVFTGSLRIVPIILLQLWIYLYVFEHVDDADMTTVRKLLVSTPGMFGIVLIYHMFTRQAIVHHEKEPTEYTNMVNERVMPQHQRRVHGSWTWACIAVFDTIVGCYVLVLHRYVMDYPLELSLYTSPVILLLLVFFLSLVSQHHRFILSDISPAFISTIHSTNRKWKANR